MWIGSAVRARRHHNGHMNNYDSLPEAEQASLARAGYLLHYAPGHFIPRTHSYTMRRRCDVAASLLPTNACFTHYTAAWLHTGYLPGEQPQALSICHASAIYPPITAHRQLETNQILTLAGATLTDAETTCIDLLLARTPQALEYALILLKEVTSPQRVRARISEHTKRRGRPGLGPYLDALETYLKRQKRQRNYLPNPTRI